MPRNLQPQRQQIDPTGPYYGEYSRLAEQFLKPNKPIHSAGQGIAEVLGDVGEAYFLKKAAQKEQEKGERDYSDLAMAKRLATDSGLARDQNSGAMYSSQDFGGLQTQGIDPMSAQQRGAAAYNRLAETNPRAAGGADPGSFAELAQQFEPPSFTGKLGPGESAFANGKTIASVPAHAPRVEQSPLARMLAERDALPQGDPKRTAYDAAITQATTREPRAPNNVQTETFDDGIFVINPDGSRGARLGNAPARERMPRVKTYYDEEGNPLTLDANDPIDQATIKERSLVESAPTEAERVSKGFLDRMTAAEPNMQSVVDQGYDPSNFRDKNIKDLPFGNYGVSDQGQLYRQAQEDWVRAKLRKESGAVIGDDEMEREIKTYFPQPGDSPGVQAQKAVSRKGAERQLATTAGLLGRKYLRGDAEKKAPVASEEGVPEGIDANIWKFMTPEERALWSK